MTRTISVCLVAMMFLAVPLRAQQATVVSASMMRDVLADQAVREHADRASVVQFLRGPDARDVAERFGLDLKRAEAAVATLSSEELASLAARIPAADADLAGGLQLNRTHYMILGGVVLVILVAILLAGDGYGSDY